MTPRMLFMAGYLLLLLCPMVSPQINILSILKTSVCVLCSSVFVLASCAQRVNPICRIIVFKLRLLCLTFPCTNYGAPRDYSCTVPVFGCFPWRIKPLGLCQPFRVCCGGGIFNLPVRNAFSGLSALTKHTSLAPSGYRMGGDVTTSVLGLDDQLANHTFSSGFRLPVTPREYMKDWPTDQDDPVIVEELIRNEYVKFLKELNAINKEETRNGGEATRTPSFHEFRSVALGEITTH